MKCNTLARCFVWTTIAALPSTYIGAAAPSVDVANIPLVSTSTKVVRPNVYFILDDSTSMTWTYMPDSSDDEASRCYKNHGYNKIYYNPYETYDSPLTSTGASFTNAVYNSAETNGFDTTGSNTDLRSKFQAYPGESNPNPPSGSDGPGYYARYTANPANPPSTCAADSAYTLVPIPTTGTAADSGRGFAAEQTNFANWYSFYRTRLLMMKSAAGRAFVGVDDKFRVGFSTINETGTSSTSRWLRMNTFNTTQKNTWYSRLYGVSISGTQYTPLRGALSKAGRYYAGTLVTGANDPVQYSCQKNFTILTTDGYWNTANESSSYGPKREDNTTNVGDQDGDIATSPRPMYESGGYSNTLADVARYYFRTDLRTGTATGGTPDSGPIRVVADNALDSDGNVLPEGHQHMKTTTLGMGLNGLLAFPTDLAGLTDGSRAWPDPETSNNTSTAMPASRLDDLWHAAVNGKGDYLSANDAEEVVDALRAALATIVDQDRSGAAAATSSLEPVTGDNYAYIARYTTSRWHGDLEARTIDLDTGDISASVVWNAQDQLDALGGYNTDTRDIYTYNGSSRVNFTLANVTSTNFESSTTNPNGALSQYAGWNAAQRTAATPAALIAYLRGQNEHEMQTDGTHTTLTKRLFRDREHLMGDVVDSSPVYVKKAPFRYADTGYASYAGAQLTRAGTVYVGANDGMLHAFDADTGAERWAYMPRLLHPMLYKLADANYAANHRYYVNGSITVGDAFDGTNWRTVLVAGLASGGKGYFALDITDPENPQVLWEFSNANVGESFGNPVLTKRNSDNTWVVLLTSGYNNDTGGGDGRGRLYMLNAITGATIGTMQTGAGTNAAQTGLAKITNWVLDTVVDNNTQYVYGGDLAGNLWRFDINALAVQKMGQTSATIGALPITSRPEVARLRDSAGNYHRIVYIGTGRYLGAADMTGASTAEVNQQGMFAIKDTSTDLGVFTAAGAALVAQTLNTAGTPRTIPSPQPVDWTTHNGWYMRIPLLERITIEPRLQLGTISFVANYPVDEYCFTGGTSWLYMLDYRTGGAITSSGTNHVGFMIDPRNIATGLTIVRLPNGKLIAIINKPSGTQSEEIQKDDAGSGSVRRVGYREIN